MSTTNTQPIFDAVLALFRAMEPMREKFYGLERFREIRDELLEDSLSADAYDFAGAMSGGRSDELDALNSAIKRCLARDVHCDTEDEFDGLPWVIREGVRTFWFPVEDGDLPTVEECTRHLYNQLDSDLNELATSEWIALYPLERLFESFDAAVDFGSFSVVNPNTPRMGPHRNSAYDLKRVLAEDCGIVFGDSVENEGSYNRCIQHIAHETHWYIPGRPQLLFEVGRGDPNALWSEMRDKLAAVLPALRFTEFIYEVVNPDSPLTADRTWERCASARRPDGTPMSNRLVEMPSVALLLKQRNGTCAWTDEVFPKRPTYYFELQALLDGLDMEYEDLDGNPVEHVPTKTTPGAIERPLASHAIPDDREKMTELPLAIEPGFEGWDGEGYHQGRFVATWAQIQPIQDDIRRLRTDTGRSGQSLRNKVKKDVLEAGLRIGDALNRAMIIVGNRLRRRNSERLMAAFFAFETVIDPFFQTDSKEQRFHNALNALVPGPSIEVATPYDLRSRMVHRSDFHDPHMDDDLLLRRVTEGLLRAMNEIRNWALPQLEGNLLSKAGFRRFVDSWGQARPA
jgi:hypothetical protein